MTTRTSHDAQNGAGFKQRQTASYISVTGQNDMPPHCKSHYLIQPNIDINLGLNVEFETNMRGNTGSEFSKTRVNHRPNLPGGNSMRPHLPASRLNSIGLHETMMPYASRPSNSELRDSATTHFTQSVRLSKKEREKYPDTQINSSAKNDILSQRGFRPNASTSIREESLTLNNSRAAEAELLSYGSRNIALRFSASVSSTTCESLPSGSQKTQASFIPPVANNRSLAQSSSVRQDPIDFRKSGVSSLLPQGNGKALKPMKDDINTTLMGKTSPITSRRVPGQPFLPKLAKTEAKQPITSNAEQRADLNTPMSFKNPDLALGHKSKLRNKPGEPINQAKPLNRSFTAPNFNGPRSRMGFGPPNLGGRRNRVVSVKQAPQIGFFQSSTVNMPRVPLMNRAPRNGNLHGGFSGNMHSPAFLNSGINRPISNQSHHSSQSQIKDPGFHHSGNYSPKQSSHHHLNGNHNLEDSEREPGQGRSDTLNDANILNHSEDSNEQDSYGQHILNSNSESVDYNSKSDDLSGLSNFGGVNYDVIQEEEIFLDDFDYADIGLTSSDDLGVEHIGLSEDDDIFPSIDLSGEESLNKVASETYDNTERDDTDFAQSRCLPESPTNDYGDSNETENDDLSNHERLNYDDQNDERDDISITSNDDTRSDSGLYSCSDDGTQVQDDSDGHALAEDETRDEFENHADDYSNDDEDLNYHDQEDYNDDTLEFDNGDQDHDDNIPECDNADEGYAENEDHTENESFDPLDSYTYDDDYTGGNDYEDQADVGNDDFNQANDYYDG